MQFTISCFKRILHRIDYLKHIWFKLYLLQILCKFSEFFRSIEDLSDLYDTSRGVLIKFIPGLHSPKYFSMTCFRPRILISLNFFTVLFSIMKMFVVMEKSNREDSFLFATKCRILYCKKMPQYQN